MGKRVDGIIRQRDMFLAMFNKLDGSKHNRA